ncbi:unnamed protein product [Dovyalis caffra]|uniref:Serine carboxypeptidase n=1 Tax=Dovyalis caffra TaxID=77055 RepID=A0AAV1RE13_9ROSI|nr:unnamed protein product [Dovyalis caffra]
MNSLQFLLQWLHLSFICLQSTVSAERFNLRGLNPLGSRLSKSSDKMASTSGLEDFKTFYYNQTPDHFNFMPESYTTFQQKYVINFKYWGGANASAPIFAYLGAEDALGNSYLSFIGFLTENAPHFKALLV